MQTKRILYEMKGEKGELKSLEEQERGRGKGGERERQKKSERGG